MLKLLVVKSCRLACFQITHSSRRQIVARNYKYFCTKSEVNHETASTTEDPQAKSSVIAENEKKEEDQPEEVEEIEEKDGETSSLQVPGVGMLQDPIALEEEKQAEAEEEIIPDEIIGIDPITEEFITDKTESKEYEEEESETKEEDEDFWTKWTQYFKQKMTPKIGWWLNFGNGLAIVSMLMEDMLTLRCLLVGANICAFTFYRSSNLYLPSYWSLFFLCGHSVMVARLLMENRSVNMSDVEHEVYCNAFREYGFSPFQFKRVMSIAKYMRVHKGDIICNEGTPKENTMYLLGSCELQQNGNNVGGIINGIVGDLIPNKRYIEQKIEEKDQKHSKQQSKSKSDEMNEEVMVNEPSLPSLEIVSDIAEVHDVAEQSQNVKHEDPTKEEEQTTFIAQKLTHIMDDHDIEQYDPDVWHHTVVALDACTIFVWDKNELHKILTSDIRINAASEKAVAGDLRHKLKTDKKFNSIKSYRNMLEIVIFDGSITAEEKMRLDKFREDNNISIGEHEAVVKSFGWSMREYERGLQDVTSGISKLRQWYLLNMTTRYTTTN